MSKKTCPRCQHNKIEADDNFCEICGLDLRREAAGETTALIKEQLRLLQVRKRRIEKRVTDPEERQRLLTALEAHCCSLQSFLQQRE
ncbi:zinc ribbon domain-containing protein [Paenibacillus thiaminolyticus]|uniref:Zinc ribbon domain-containing protein n=1 Tax=Paenibacillus thiaminolyticus TaxID=49283 RepID=A0A3A3GNJ9_PANTH|nr:hypothetical protein DQX05_01130 [Paenibacillus thiaminolyticus]